MYQFLSSNSHQERRQKPSVPKGADPVTFPELPLWAHAFQDDVAAVASVATIRASELLPGLTVEAAHPVTAAPASYNQPATVHKMPFLQKSTGRLLLTGCAVLLRAKQPPGMHLSCLRQALK